jgi:hypothetical protein
MRAFAEWVVGQRDDKQLPDEFHKELRKAMKEDAKRPRVGEKVSWKSQANGHWTAKTGKVIEVVDAMAVPKKFKGKKNGELPKRKHESYVVEANGQTYWPLVSQLKRIEAR